MSRMTKQNLQNIRNRFEEKTGVSLGKQKRGIQISLKKAAALVVAAALCLALVGFTYPLFSPLDADELSLAGEYQGGGIVLVHVENRSDKALRFQPKTKLMRWIKSEEVERLGGSVSFENTVFPAHSSGTMTIDLSQAYDMVALEQEGNNPETYYLLLTNNNFLFGHDWMCSVSFREPVPEETVEREPEEQVPAEHPEAVEEGLQFYFENDYQGAPVSLNEANFAYQQKVEEVLTRSGKRIVPALSPSVMVGAPSVFLDPEPMLKKLPEGVVFDESLPEQEQYLLGLDEWHFTDAYGRMIATFQEKAWTLTTTIPQWEGQRDGGCPIPLVFWMVYDAKEASWEDSYAFVYGKILSFAEMEQEKVYQDEYYVIYDVTDRIYTDLDGYLDYFLSCYADIHCDEQIRSRVHAVYRYYRNREHFEALYSYWEPPVQ